MRWLAFLLLIIPAQLLAQVMPEPGMGDPRFQTLTYGEDAVYSLSIDPGYQTAVIFAASEEVQSIALGDSSSWQVTPSGRGDTIFVRANAGALPTNMTVITDARIYVFELIAGSATSAWVVRFAYNSGESQEVIEQIEDPAITYTYRLSGAKILYPDGIEDDGQKTYISWPTDSNMPAVFAKNDAGGEQVVDGQVRNGIFTIDRVYEQLIFRLDKRKAVAKRNKLR